MPERDLSMLLSCRSEYQELKDAQKTYTFTGFAIEDLDLSLVTRKPNFRVYDLVRHKPACAPQKLARFLKFGVYNPEAFHYLVSEQQRC